MDLCAHRPIASEYSQVNSPVPARRLRQPLKRSVLGPALAVSLLDQESKSCPTQLQIVRVSIT